MDGKGVLAVIPARGGSKGIPGKNLRLLGQKPLIAWTIEAAQRSRLIDRVIVSTDSFEIAELAKSMHCDVPFMRPDDLSGDGASTATVMLHALSSLQERYNYLVVLQPTSPLRGAEDIDACIRQCIESSASSLVSVVQTAMHPKWMFSLDSGQRLLPVLPMTDAGQTSRQMLPPIFMPNGAVYVVECNWFNTHQRFIDTHTLAYVMPAERSVDIDEEMDLLVAEALMRGKVA